jgi:hypothetical protein
MIRNSPLSNAATPCLGGPALHARLLVQFKMNNGTVSDQQRPLATVKRETR